MSVICISASFSEIELGGVIESHEVIGVVPSVDVAGSIPAIELTGVLGEPCA